MTDIFLLLLILAILATPVLGVMLVVKALKKKAVLKTAIALVACVISIIPLAVLVLLPNAVRRCDHEYEITNEVAATCTERGETRRLCSLCGDEQVDYIDTIPHEWVVMENGATERCVRCDLTREVGGEDIGDDTLSNTPTASPTDWRNVLSSKGFTDDEISEYEEILTNVGITDYHDVGIIENGIMHIVRGKIYDSNVLQLNVTLENRKIIVVTLAGIPDYETEAYINWRGKLKFKKEQSKLSIDLYYDVEGGYVAKLDWEKMLITPYEEVEQ